MYNNQNTRTITIENARILFRNFSGLPSQFNAAGNRNFCVILEDMDLVRQLEEDGWNIRYLRPLEDTDEPKPYLQVRAYYPKEGSRARPPKIVMITSRGSTLLDENTVNLLDTAEIANIDMIIRPAPWEVGGRTGVKGYLKSMYVTIVEDELEKKYAAMESSAVDSVFEDNGSKSI